MSQRRLWTIDEDQIILALVKQHGTKKWTTIAQEMKKKFHKHSRTSKQIRQRWHNHLDSNVNKKQWTIQEQIILFDSHRLFGSKWKQIANKLKGRTDNHVKNYFYSTMRRALRRVNKFLGSKNSTTQMRNIRPSILSYLLELADQDIEIRSLVSRILELSKLKPTKSSIHKLFIQKQKENYQSAINKLMQINQAYSKTNDRKLNSIPKAKVQKINSNQTEIKQQYVSQQENLNSQGQQQKDWEDKNVEYHHCFLMPQIQKPEYQCDLLVKKQQNTEQLSHPSFQGFDNNLAHRIQIFNLFEF